MDGWRLVARTDVRTSLRNESTDETAEILYHDGLCDEYDVHSVMYSASSKAESFFVLYADGLFEINYSSVKVSPPPTPRQIAALERPVEDQSRRDRFFAKVLAPLSVLPKKAMLEKILEHARKTRYDPHLSGVPPRIDFLDLGCGNGRRVLSAAQDCEKNCVGVDLRPPIFNDRHNAWFFRKDALEFLQLLRNRQTEASAINSDFLLGRVGDGERTALVEAVAQRLLPGGEFRFCEQLAVAKKVVATAKMFPDLSIRGCGFSQSKEWVGKTSVGRAQFEAFFQKHPDFEAEMQLKTQMQEKKGTAKTDGGVAGKTGGCESKAETGTGEKAGDAGGTDGGAGKAQNGEGAETGGEESGEGRGLAENAQTAAEKKEAVLLPASLPILVIITKNPAGPGAALMASTQIKTV